MSSRIALLFLFVAQAYGVDSKSTFAGIVIDANTGEPLRKARVLVSGGNAGRFSNIQVTSGPDGRFLVSELDPGEYRVHVDRQGYLDCDCLSGVKIGTGQKVTGVQLKLTQYGAISGKVVDADGDPWAGGSVEVYRLCWQHGKRKLLSQDQEDVDDRGVFRVARLPPGKYLLAAEPTGHTPPDRVPYVTSFYPGAVEPTQAAPIQIASGQEVTDLEVKLQSAPTYSIRGKVSGFAGGQLNMSLCRTSDLWDDWMPNGASRKPDGTFEFRNVPSGSYLIKAMSISRESAGMVFNHLGETPVDVSGHDANDVAVDLIPPGRLKLSVQVEGVDHPDLSSLIIGLQSDDGSLTSASAENGYTFSNIAAGTYDIQLRGPGSAKYFVKSPGPVIDLRQTGDAPVTVVLSDKGAEITATIKDAPDLSRTTVTLIPDIADADVRQQLTVSANHDQNGVYTFKNIPPGDYRLFAWRDQPQDAFEDPDLWPANRNKGVSMKLADSERKAIELPLVQ